MSNLSNSLALFHSYNVHNGGLLSALIFFYCKLEHATATAFMGINACGKGALKILMIEMCM